jgi:hypothetical protein
MYVCKYNFTQIRSITVNSEKTQHRDLTLKHKEMPKSYRWGKFDLFMEAAWAVINQKIFKFEEFSESN